MGMNSGVSPGLPMARVQGHAERQPVKVALEPCLRMATLPGLPWDCRWLDAVKPGLREFPRCKRHTKFHAQCHTPFGSLQIPRARSYSAFVREHVGHQSFGGISAIGFFLRIDPFCIRVAGRWFTNRTQPALCGTVYKCLKDIGGHLHRRSLPLATDLFGERYPRLRNQTPNEASAARPGACYPQGRSSFECENSSDTEALSSRVQQCPP